MRKDLFITTLLLTLFGTFALAHDKRGSGNKEEAYRFGYDEGYRDGARHGEEDYRTGRGYDLKSEEYKKADRGYEKSMKHKGEYKEGYREGYELGYRDGYEGTGFRGGSSRRFPGRDSDRDRYPDRRDTRARYPDRRDSRFPDRASRDDRAFEFGVEQGYRDGYEKGEGDYKKSRTADVTRHDKYHDADDGYRSSYGDKREYQGGYRVGFEDGYGDGFHGDRRSRASRTRNSSILGRGDRPVAPTQCAWT